MVFQTADFCDGTLWTDFARKAGIIELVHYVFLLSIRFADCLIRIIYYKVIIYEFNKIR